MATDVLTPFRDRRVLAAGVIVFALGWFSARVQTPAPPQAPDRPVLTAIARLAKAALWVLVVEPPPPEEPTHYVVRADVDRINHREGW